MELSKWVDDNSISLNLVIGDNNIKQCHNMLSNIVNICDEIIIIYTGENELETIQEIAKIYKAKLIRFKWCDDFSAARNFALNNATKAVNLRLDYDEVITQKDAINVWALSNRGEVDGYVFPVKNYLSVPKQGQKPEWFYSQSIRMFKNNPKLQYEGLVHEEIDGSFKQLNGVNLAFSQTFINHYGYLQKNSTLEAKFDKYYQLNLKQIEKTPDKYYPYHSIATHFKHVGKIDEAMEWYQKAIKVEPRGFLSHVGIAEILESRGKVDEAKTYYQMALDTKNKLMGKEMRQFIINKIVTIVTKNEMKKIDDEYNL